MSERSVHPASEQTNDLVKKGQAYYVPNYKPREMILDRGEGATVWDLDGNDYIDLGAGIAVCSLGHQDPDLKQALFDQANKLWHTSNIFFTEPTISLSESLVEATPFAKRVYLCNSGVEANEAAIKLVRKYASDQGKAPERREIITFKGSFHGRSMATVTATAQPKYQQGYEPLPGGFVYCDFNDEDAIISMVSEKTCAIMVEPVQGEGGIVPTKSGYLKLLRKLCDDHGALLMLDEIQCGMGRTGKLFAYMHDGVDPDVMTLAKALGGGVPIGAALVGEKLEQTFQFGSHGSTFGGNPVMCAVALASLKKINTQDTLGGVEEKGQRIQEALCAIGERVGCFAEVRGRGLMIGAELAPEWHGKAGEISEAARKEGVLVLVAGPDVVRLLPPLNISDTELQEGLLRLEKAIRGYLQANAGQEEAVR